MPTNLNINVTIPDIITALDRINNITHDQNVDRAEATQAIAKHLGHAFPNKNVMVVHSSHIQTFNGSVHHHIEIPQTFGTIGYEIYVFDDGEFTLLGDAGYINWAFHGNFQKDGKHVLFFRR